jgi:hypothetical protein
MAMVSLAGLMLAAGCSFAPIFTKPTVPTAAAFKELTPAQANATDGWKTAAPSDNLIRGQWWEVFQEPELNAFESQVADANQSVAVALANFLAARAVVKQARSQYFPTVTARAFGHSIPTVNPGGSVNGGDEHGVCAAHGRLVGAGFVGPHPEHRKGQLAGSAGDASGSWERAADRGGGGGGGLF